MVALKIENLSKDYPKFSLKRVSFSVNEGEILGFIGRNGAGKTTTLKCIMNLLHYEEGNIYAFEKDMTKHSLENKQDIGFALSELNYYPNKTIKQLMNVTKKFYSHFDEEKVKYSVAIALSHDAKLLILDEPTSGLDPVSRDEILDIFRSIVKNKKRAILFSTHITSDLDKCASNITYIHDGNIIYTGKKNDFVQSYLFVKDKSYNQKLLDEYISYKEIDNHVEGLISADKKKLFTSSKIELSVPDLEQIMVYLERRNKNEKFAL